MDTLFDLTPAVIGAIPLTVGLVQAIKIIGIPDRFIPITSISVGIALMLLTGAIWQVSIASGIIVGLAACGLWSGAKTTFAPQSMSSLG